MIESIGFTGTREGLSYEQRVALVELVDRYLKTTKIKYFNHGDCVGADEQFHNIVQQSSRRYRVPAHVVIHPPENSVERAFCIGDLKPEKPYLVRDKCIVDSSQVLLACPRTSEPVPRSGTWFTANYAIKSGKIVRVINRDGSIKVHNELV